MRLYYFVCAYYGSLLFTFYFEASASARLERISKPLLTNIYNTKYYNISHMQKVIALYPYRAITQQPNNTTIEMAPPLPTGISKNIQKNILRIPVQLGKLTINVNTSINGLSSINI